MNIDRSRRSYPILVSTVVLATTACLVPKLDPEIDPSTSSSSVSTTSGPAPTSEPTTIPPPE